MNNIQGTIKAALLGHHLVMEAAEETKVTRAKSENQEEPNPGSATSLYKIMVKPRRVNKDMQKLYPVSLNLKTDFKLK